MGVCCSRINFSCVARNYLYSNVTGVFLRPHRMPIDCAKIRDPERDVGGYTDIKISKAAVIGEPQRRNRCIDRARTLCGVIVDHSSHVLDSDKNPDSYGYSLSNGSWFVETSFFTIAPIYSQNY